MTYIRTKKIGDKSYAYLVESINTKSGPRQKVKQYLGRVYELEKLEKKQNDNFFEIKDSKSDILRSLILNELVKRGFKKNNDLYINKNLIFSQKKFTLKKKTRGKKTNKEAIIKLDNGYLCSFTLRRIADFKKSKDFNKDAYLLAKYFLEAGLPITRDIFVKFYRKL